MGCARARSVLFYLVFPVSAAAVRADVAHLDVTQFAHWGVRTTYAVDPPTNCFPSLHLAFATLSMLCAGTARRLWGWVALPLVVGIAASIVTMKQHFIADGVAGVALAWGLWRWLMAPDRFERPQGEQTARSWRGPVTFCVLAAAVYAGFYVAFRSGWQAWR